MRNWLLPEYVEDVLPCDAAHVESLRRKLLDLFKVHGYLYVIPPMLEYMESLITGTGHDLDIATFKVVDQLTGRLMGVRADTTPQAARIDAHILNYQGVARLCYAGTVLRTKPDGLARTREPLQLGAELFGHAGIESDLEIQGLMIKALEMVGLNELHIDFSHVGIFKSILDTHKDISSDLQHALYMALQNKDKAGLANLSAVLPKETRDSLMVLIDLNGDKSVLQRAGTLLPKNTVISEALYNLHLISNELSSPRVHIGFDLSELRGYHYHSGIVFAAYAHGYSGPIALGGRYDDVGKSFGRARPATGFSLDLRGVISALKSPPLAKAILAPYGNQNGLLEQIAILRGQGEVVIQALPNSNKCHDELNCDRALVLEQGQWRIQPLN